MIIVFQWIKLLHNSFFKKFYTSILLYKIHLKGIPVFYYILYQYFIIHMYNNTSNTVIQSANIWYFFTFRWNKFLEWKCHQFRNSTIGKTNISFRESNLLLFQTKLPSVVPALTAHGSLSHPRYTSFFFTPNTRQIFISVSHVTTFLINPRSTLVLLNPW